MAINLVIMKTRTKIFLAIVAVLLILQLPFFTPKKNYSEIDSKTDITDKYEVPMNIQMDLYNACYDCHSNNSKAYPWYFHIQPVSWWMDKHIQEAKKHINFSEFANYSPEETADKFKKLSEVMTKHAMPLKSYLWMHDEAVLSDDHYKNVANWAQKMYKKTKAEMAEE